MRERERERAQNMKKKKAYLHVWTLAIKIVSCVTMTHFCWHFCSWPAQVDLDHKDPHVRSYLSKMGNNSSHSVDQIWRHVNRLDGERNREKQKFVLMTGSNECKCNLLAVFFIIDKAAVIKKKLFLCFMSVVFKTELEIIICRQLHFHQNSFFCQLHFHLQTVW